MFRHAVLNRAVLPLILALVAASAIVSCARDDEAADSDAATETDIQGTSDDTAAGSDQPSSPVAGSIKVLTYNVHGLPPIISGDDTTGRYKLIGPKLNAYDLIGVQEDWIDDNHKLLKKTVKLAHVLRFDAKLQTPEGELDKVYGSGLSLFSGYKFVLSAPEHYGNCNGLAGGASDCFASKGFQFARMSVGAKTIDIYNTHLEAGGGKDDEAVRAKQVDQLLAAVKKHSTGRAAILMGDFNLKRKDPPDAPLLDKIEAVFNDSCAAVKCAAAEHIDRVFFKSGTDVQLTVTSWKNESKSFRDDDGHDLSDHPPIHAIVNWKIK